jgi:hypothetical protein
MLVLVGCADHTIEEPPIDLSVVEFNDPLEDLPDEGSISFQEPKVGQRSAYVFFEAINTRSTVNVDIKYHTDTLIIAITGKQGSKWIIKDFLTQWSNARVDPENSLWGNVADSVFSSQMEIDDETVHIFREDVRRDALTFCFMVEQKFPLDLVPDNFPENPAALPFFSVGAGQWMEYVKNFVRIGTTYNKLNIFFDYTWITVDGPGFMHVYGPEDGLVRSTKFNPWVPDEVVGWDVIPRE